MAVPLFYYRSEVNIMQVQLSADERLDVVNERLRLIQKKNGLTFGTDAYLLAAFMRPEPGARGAELGSGTGIVSMLAATRGKLAHIDAFELQPEFSELGARNISLNGLADVIDQHTADIRTLGHGRDTGTLDVVFTNPPYMKDGHGRDCAHSFKHIARHETAGDIDAFCAAGARLLRYGGRFYCVYRPDRLSDLMQALRSNRLEPKRMTLVQPDAATPPCMVLVEARLGGAPSLTLTPGLLLFRLPVDGSLARVMTPEAEAVYAGCKLY